MKLAIKKGATSQSIGVKLIDSSVTTGAGLTAKVFSDITTYWYQPGVSAAAQVTMATLASATAAWGTGGFILVSDANMPGHYRFDIPNALLTGADRVYLNMRCTGAVPVDIEIQLTGVDLGAVPGTDANALFIAGTNLATTISSSAGSALTLTSTGTNGSGLLATGNGSGDGIKTTGGATGHGIETTGGGSGGNGLLATGTSNSHGIHSTGSGTGSGISGLGGATGQGILGTGGGTSGNGLKGIATAGNSSGASFVGNGTGPGMIGTGGATGPGISGVGGGTSGKGILVTSDASAVSGAVLSSGTSTDQIEVSSGDVLVVSAVTGAVGSVTGAVGSVTGSVGGNVSGNVTGSVGSVASGGITATSIAADAIGASELATDAVAEIAAAVWATVVETAGSYTAKQALDITFCAAAGVTASSGSVLKTPDGTATRITSTLSSNNRTAQTLNPSA